MFKGIQSLTEKVSVPRSIHRSVDVVREVELHVFGDASLSGVAAIVYACVMSETGGQQGVPEYHKKTPPYHG